MDVISILVKRKPIIRWMDTIKHDMNKCGLEERDTKVGENVI